MEEIELQSLTESCIDKYVDLLIIYFILFVLFSSTEKGRAKTNYPEGNWKRLSSYVRGEYLKMEDEVR